eukprot:4106584-Amphidinium_carterae.1
MFFDSALFPYLEGDENRFSGSLPGDGMKGMAQVRIFSLMSNELSGSLPDGIQGMTLLSWYDVSQNHLTGSLPSRGLQGWQAVRRL